MICTAKSDAIGSVTVSRVDFGLPAEAGESCGLLRRSPNTVGLALPGFHSSTTKIHPRDTRCTGTPSMSRFTSLTWSVAMPGFRSRRPTTLLRLESDEDGFVDA